MTWTALSAVQAWRGFAESMKVSTNRGLTTWSAYVRSGNFYADEKTIVQPIVFPRFAESLLGYEIGATLAPERHDREGAPDFTPADAVTHPFVFETKGTDALVALRGNDPQVLRYLTHGAPRIRHVVLTNLVGLRVMELRNSVLNEVYSIDLRFLLAGDASTVVTSGHAQRLAQFLDDFAHQSLTATEKLDRVRQAPPWSPFEVTDADWVSERVNRAVVVVERDVTNRVGREVLDDPSFVPPHQRAWILDELRLLDWRVGGPAPSDNTRELADYRTASDDSTAGIARRQYIAHVAYYSVTKLMLVRVWEDLGLLSPMLNDGGFDNWMERLDDVVNDVVLMSFSKAKDRYPSLFEGTNTYTWYVPAGDAYTEVIYELGNTFFGDIQSDVLGIVYERMLERIDRKLLGQYYTPRDIISLIWDLVDGRDVTRTSAESGRAPRVLDIATGSGGFLVDIANTSIQYALDHIAVGASLDPQAWLSSVVDGLHGSEIQRFSAFLAELNLLIQFARLMKTHAGLKVPEIGILNMDTLSLHNPEQTLLQTDLKPVDPLAHTHEKEERARRIQDPRTNDYWLDVAVGNPPYVGERLAAAVMRRTRDEYPYWNSFVGQHQDYLYWFLILGISKLDKGGRFGFITTEYWLRSVGAKPLRGYLAQRCEIDRIVLFRDFRLFPDAPGQHSMIVVGRRSVPNDFDFDSAVDKPSEARPTVSIVKVGTVRGVERRNVLKTIAEGRRTSKVSTFNAPISPNVLGDSSWSEVVLTAQQVRRRRSLRAQSSLIEVDTDEGVLSSADRMRAGYDAHLSQRALSRIGFPARKAGIFAITKDEVAALGHLTREERQALRPIINTKDVMPYAAVLAPDAATMIYLPSPSGANRQHAPFPANMPSLREHLSQFKPLLEAKIAQYGEDRPWWSLHRPRPGIVARDVSNQQWGEYCLTTRWGNGGRLVVGLPPRGTVPASGLHALLPPSDVPAPYLCALFNSTVVQDLAETLPPGNLTAADIRELGLPLVSEIVEQVTQCGRRLGDLVAQLAQRWSDRYPTLRTSMCDEIAFEVLPEPWLPKVGASAHWGTIASVGWTTVSQAPAGSGAMKSVAVVESIFGWDFTVEDAMGRGMHISLNDREPRMAEAFKRFLLGLAAVGTKLPEITRAAVPTEPDALAVALAADDDALEVLRSDYRRLREMIDDLVQGVI